MAKLSSLLGISGTIGGYTTVNSKAYNTHIRAARGSKSKVEVNDTLKVHNLLLMSANVPARLVKTSIDLYRADFPSGQLWQYLVGMFKKQLKMEISLSIHQLINKDINPDYPLSRLTRRGFKLMVTPGPGTIRVDIQNLSPEFRRKTIDGYQIEVAAIFIDFDRLETTSDRSVSQVLPLSHPGILTFDFKAGKPGDQYLICLKIAGGCKGEVQSDNSLTAMKIIHTGTVE